MNPPRIGQVGCGKWGRHILRDLVALGASVVVVARSPRSQANAAEHRAAAIVDYIDRLPRDLDAIVVATTIPTHGPVTEALLDRGVPILVEKPLADDVAQAERLAAAPPGRVFVKSVWRYHPGIAALAEIARSRELGDVDHLRTSRLGWGLAHDTDAIWSLVPHDLSIAVEILGRLPEPRFAHCERRDREVVGLAAVLGPSPAVIIDASIRSPVRVRRVTLACRDGVATLDNAYADHLVVCRDGGSSEEKRPIATTMPLRIELDAFLRYLVGGPPPKTSAAEGAAMVRAIARMRAMGDAAA